jgi:hypothetical protein
MADANQNRCLLARAVAHLIHANHAEIAQLSSIEKAINVAMALLVDSHPLVNALLDIFLTIGGRLLVRYHRTNPQPYEKLCMWYCSPYCSSLLISLCSSLVLLAMIAGGVGESCLHLYAWLLGVSITIVQQTPPWNP